MQPKEKTIHHDIPMRPWDVIGAEVIFAEYGIPQRIMSDTGSNFISEKFKNFCNSLSIEQVVSLL